MPPPKAAEIFGILSVKQAEQLFTGLLRLAYITTISYFFFAGHSSRFCRHSLRVGAASENS